MCCDIILKLYNVDITSFWLLLVTILVCIVTIYIYIIQIQIHPFPLSIYLQCIQRFLNKAHLVVLAGDGSDVLCLELDSDVAVTALVTFDNKLRNSRAFLVQVAGFLELQ